MKEILVGLLIVAFGLLSLEIGVAAPILEIVAGVIGANLFQLTGMAWMDFIANFGILGLMFFAGLEVDREELKRNAGEASLVALSAYFIPFTATFLVTWVGFGFKVESSALTAVALSTTSLALVYPILKKRGMLEEKIGHILITSAMIIDVLSMISLAVLFRAFDNLTIIFFIITVLFMYHAPKLGNSSSSSPSYSSRRESGLVRPY